MIPETNAVNKIILYEAINFPYQWQYYKTLLEIKAVDTVVYQSSIDKKTKIITTKKENEDKYITQLYDFDIDDFKLTLVFESEDKEKSKYYLADNEREATKLDR